MSDHDTYLKIILFAGALMFVAARVLRTAWRQAKRISRETKE